MVPSALNFWCAGCQSYVTRDLFAKNKNRPNGLHAYCLACNRRKQAAERARRGDDYRAMRRRYRQTDSGRQAYNRYRVAHPGKAYAQQTLQHAVERGLLVRPATCMECGETGIIDAHHDDYAQPLAVRWLCRWCHQEWHRLNGEALNADLAPPEHNTLRELKAKKAERIPLVLAMHAEGKSQKEIAAHFGVTGPTIHSYLKQFGLTTTYSSRV